MMRLTWSTLSSGCAAATPTSESARTLSGELMSFFMRWAPLDIGGKFRRRLAIASSHNRTSFDNVEYPPHRCGKSRGSPRNSCTRLIAADDPRKEPGVIQAIDRAAKILSLIQGARHLGITELAVALGLPPSTVHGIVKSLQIHGLVAKEPNGNRYMLGPALLKLSNVYLDTLDVRARAMSWTRELARRTGLAVRLGAELLDAVRT